MAAIAKIHGSHREGLSKAVRQNLLAWAYIAPSALVMAVITFYPQIYQVWMAFTDFGAANIRPENPPDFVGFRNFVRILTNDMPAIQYYDFGRLLLFNVVWTVSNVFLHVVLGVAIALALNAKGLLFRRVYRVIFVIPWALPSYITALVWHNMFDQNYGAINLLAAKVNDLFRGTFLGAAYGPTADWLSQFTWTPIYSGLPERTNWLSGAVIIPIDFLPFLPLAFYAVLIANTWLGWPFMTVVATGALQSIPYELYEAAEVDGAGKWRQFWSITLPLLRPAMVPAIMLGTIWTFNQFNVIYFISNGEPQGMTEILVTQAYKIIQQYQLYGLAAAFSIVVFFILLIITLINNYVTKATEAYDVA